MKRSLMLLSALLAILFCISSCDRVRQIVGLDETDTDALSTEDTDAETFELPRAQFTDPITGEPTESDLSKSRPLAVVVKNDRAAAPQYGLSRAAVVYEALVEGGLTRFLAVYSDVSAVSKVGPVIDSRSYFYDFAANHNAVFVQAGTTSNGNRVQVERGITALDAVVGEMTPGFYRDDMLRTARGSENSVVTDANGLKARATSFGISLTEDSHTLPYQTVDYLDNRDMTGGGYCTYLKIPFSVNMEVEYSYSTLTNTYARTQYGEPHIDAETEKQLKFTNIIVIIAEHTTVDAATGEMDIQNKGKGSGYYIYGGSRIMITWQRSGGSEPIKLFESDGITPLLVSSGNTYIAVVSPRLSGKIEFERASS